MKRQEIHFRSRNFIVLEASGGIINFCFWLEAIFMHLLLGNADTLYSFVMLEILRPRYMLLNDKTTFIHIKTRRQF